MAANEMTAFLEENSDANVFASMKIPDIYKLDVNNVIQLLAQAEREKADALWQECVKFCHANLDNVLNTQGNAVFTISETSVKKIAELFHHNEADVIKDKKDRIKSKIFRYLTERLLSEEPKPELGCPESAAELLICRACGQLVTPSTMTKIKCRPGHFTLDQHGNLVPQHIRDDNWEVQAFVKNAYFRFRSWRRVYWFLWGNVHWLPCSKCKEMFPCCQMGQCRYHPDAAQYPLHQESHPDGTIQAIGRYSCCEATACRFDPWDLLDKGCKMRDHVVNTNDPLLQCVHHDLLMHREFICSSMAAEHPISPPPIGPKDEPVSEPSVDDCSVQPPKLQRAAEAEVPFDALSDLPLVETSKTHCEEGDYEDDDQDEQFSSKDDDDDDDESCSSGPDMQESLSQDDTFENRAKIESRLRDKATAERMESDKITKMNRNKFPVLWDSSRSRRYNHDVLREYERRRFQEIIQRLTITNVGNEKNSGTLTRNSASQQQRHPGGLYGRIEAQWKAVHCPPPPPSLFPPRIGTSVMAIAKFKKGKKSTTNVA